MTIEALRERQPLMWINSALASATDALREVAEQGGPTFGDIEAAEGLLQRWRPALQLLFPELNSSQGLIESSLTRLPPQAAQLVCESDLGGRFLVKADHDLPVAGSIKARGGIYEVLAHAEAIARHEGLLGPDDNVIRLLAPKARELFATKVIGVGSTGNLGLSIGVMASALGFRAQVHMSHEAKEWKKKRLRDRGVEVVEHLGDYAAAVACGRAELEANPNGYFVDDENSLDLLLGYAVAALRLKKQLDEMGVVVNAENPLFVYLPCGVGGAPGGITFGLKHIFGDFVHCFYAEPVAAPAMLVRFLSNGPRSVYDVGLDNITDADGLAVAQASELVYGIVRRLTSGIYTVADDALYRSLFHLSEAAKIDIEPSAAATFLGLGLFERGAASAYLAQAARDPNSVTHLFWTTGGTFVPKEEFQRFRARGEALAGESIIGGAN